MKRAQNPIVEVDWDKSYNVASRDGEDIMYFDVKETGAGWYLSVDLDCGTSNFVGALVVDDGPYATEAQAIWGGLNCSVDWFVNNHVPYCLDDKLKRFKRREQRAAQRYRKEIMHGEVT